MGSIGFSIYGHNAFPVKNDNWHKFQATGTNKSIVGGMRIPV